MYVHVHTTTCTYHVHTMYIHVYTFTEMYIHVCTCLCFSIIVYTMSVSRCTLALSKHCTYMVQTCLYMFMPGGQDSRWIFRHAPLRDSRRGKSIVPGDFSLPCAMLTSSMMFRAGCLFKKRPRHLQHRSSLSRLNHRSTTVALHIRTARALDGCAIGRAS
jgi:hypothetical protein